MPFRLPVRVTPDLVSALSRAMAIHLHEVPSGHRSEAVARALGYGTRAAMLADVGKGDGASLRRLDVGAFVAHVRARGDWPFGADGVLSAVARASVVATAASWPGLRPSRVPDEPGAPASTVRERRERLLFADAWVVPPFIQAVSFLDRRPSGDAWTPARDLGDAASFEVIDWPEGKRTGTAFVTHESMSLAAASLGMPARPRPDPMSTLVPEHELPVSLADPVARPVDRPGACREIDDAATWSEVIRAAMTTGGLGGRSLSDGLGAPFGSLLRWRSAQTSPGPAYVAGARERLKGLVMAGREGT